MGIMMPITMSGGIQRAHQDNQADQRFEQETQFNDKRMQGLDLGMRKERLELDEFEKGLPLKQMERDAQTISARAKAAIMAIEGNPVRLADGEYELQQDQVGPFLAQTFTEMPAFGAVEWRNGKLVSGGREIPFEEAMERLVKLADPETALKLKQLEYAPAQYVVNGKVVTMTPKQAATVPGAQKLDDAKGGLDLGKANAEIGNINAQAGRHAAETQWIGPKAQADINATNALAGERRASAGAKGRDDVDKDRKVIRDEIDFVTKQIKESGSNTFAFLGDVGNLEGLDTGQKQSVVARMDQIANDPKGNAAERQIAGRYIALMQAGGYLDAPSKPQKVVNTMRQNVSREVRTDTTPPTPPVNGARQAGDGMWYVQQNGAWYRVRK
jgi:hypothetical protein